MTSFKDIAIIACGTVSLELNHLKQEGFLDTEHIKYTTPGLHEDPQELERQLVQRIKQAKEAVDKVLVVYGGKFCYINVQDPTRSIDHVIQEQGENITRIQATHCMDMVASQQERDSIAQEMAGGEKVWWMVPGWIKFRHQVFQGWDKGLATENFPKHTGGAIVLDGIGYTEEFMAEKPEEFLDYSDWMGIPIQYYPTGLDRFRDLLLQGAERLQG
ncbi:MAG: DUF1638 domain-containing protein [Desulfohalobiaceae bacterium]